MLFTQTKSVPSGQHPARSVGIHVNQGWNGAVARRAVWTTVIAVDQTLSFRPGGANLSFNQ